ncbi:Malate synthase G [BD1-7 clade bacterium]|uniref:Malate synthase G n=1 Tax=BD1-7 clade bacterium TaxID=2029982 RepID=A0A5S9NS65_9GAMM|nr:Malate synthase G [BD1-7 clade bacterium]CAA0093449.1 Malate synthase G [BD1-7 clade bacterium]
MTYIDIHGLKIDEALHRFIINEVMPGVGLSEQQIFQGLSRVVTSLADENHALLNKRAELQGMIDAWHRKRKHDYSMDEYQAFLRTIGYLEADTNDFTIETTDVDDEVARIAGPQLVVPVKNARYAINAANARWGSLYDALYGTDAMDNTTTCQNGFDTARAARVVNAAKSRLDEILPLEEGSHHDVNRYYFGNGKLCAVLANGDIANLFDERQYAGYSGEPLHPDELLFRNNGLHIALVFDENHPIGAKDRANICDIVLESAITTIQDCEDSVAAVDANDKIDCYRNWLGLMKGNLSATVDKGDVAIERHLTGDKTYIDAVGNTICAKGRSLMFVRNVGLHMFTDMVLTEDGSNAPEGLIDGFITTLIGLHDVKGNSAHRNSDHGSIYIVKPKLHGSQEVDFACRTFDLIESVLGLQQHTIKMGLMDEERRTSANLKQCIYAARQRIVFVNTGFLDRTGDEIHTSMEAGAFLPKDAMKKTPWIHAYESRNVDIALACGFRNRAQIGKGMWPKPDQMADMIREKSAHPKAGATCAWVPSPTAATLHALHYHWIDVKDVQRDMIAHPQNDSGLDALLTVPVLCEPLAADAIREEIDNNIQGILGYVSRWIDQGIGCSKVPDIHNVGLMEDRATLRISSQYLCNWLHHGLCTENDIRDAIGRMAKVVDQQNASDTSYLPLLPDIGNIVHRPALHAALELIIYGKDVVNGYTEPTLHRRRRECKSQLIRQAA